LGHYIENKLIYIIELNHNMVILVRVQYRPQEPFDDSIERFFASLRFEQRGKLEEFGFQQDKK